MHDHLCCHIIIWYWWCHMHTHMVNCIRVAVPCSENVCWCVHVGHTHMVTSCDPKHILWHIYTYMQFDDRIPEITLFWISKHLEILKFWISRFLKFSYTWNLWNFGILEILNSVIKVNISSTNFQINTVTNFRRNLSPSLQDGFIRSKGNVLLYSTS